MVLELYFRKAGGKRKGKRKKQWPGPNGEKGEKVRFTDYQQACWESYMNSLFITQMRNMVK